jgi:putative ABC transport system permease protein
MYKNFLTILLRNLYREKIYAAINVIGLALALSCSLILVCYVQNEMSYDQHNENHERIVRINSIVTTNGEEQRSAFSSLVTGPLFFREYPQAGEYVRFTRGGRRAFSYEEKEAYWDNLVFADDNVFNVFTHQEVYGDLKNSLKDPNSIAVSRSFAKFYFGDEDPVGKVLKAGEFKSRVAAVFEDLPENSHLKYNVLFSANSLKNRFYNADSPSAESLKDQNIYTYAMLAPDVDISYFNQMLQEFSDKTALAISPNRAFLLKYQATKLDDMHFDNLWQDDLPTGNIFYIYILIVIVVLILLIASINYVNLALARAIRRRKEVYVRKVLGAGRNLLIQQFMFESTFYVLIAFLLGLAMVFISKDFTFISSLVGGSEIMKQGLTSPLLLAYAFIGAVVIGVLTGIYPALYLMNVASPRPVVKSGGGKVSFKDLRSILVFFQYFITIGVISFTLLMGQQLKFVSSKPIGYKPEHKIMVRMIGVDTIEKFTLIKAEMEKNSSILGVTESSYYPGAIVEDRVVEVENKNGGIESISLNEIQVGKEFIDVMGAEMLQGRDFSKRLLTDVGNSVIVNEAMVRAMGWENPLRKRILFRDSHVIGVVKDFHFNSLHQPIKPLVLQIFDNDFSAIPSDMRGALERPIIINIDGKNVYQSINYIDSVMTQFDPVHPFEYQFVDGLLSKLYVNDVNLLNLCSVFSIVCMTISAMGLLGLSSYSSEQRKKEIAVRKVLGATIPQLITTLIKPQIILVFMASIVASVVSFRVMVEWLSNFAYRTSIEPWVFIAATVAVGVVAFVTMAVQTSRTALSNPIHALRCE